VHSRYAAAAPIGRRPCAAAALAHHPPMPPPPLVQWRRLPANDAANDTAAAAAPPPPLVVLVAWMNAVPRHVGVYEALFARLGCDTAAVYPPTLHMWLPGRAAALATALAEALAADVAARGPRPLLLVSFSGGAKACTYQLLQARAACLRAFGQQALLRGMLTRRCGAAQALAGDARYAPLRACLAGAQRRVPSNTLRRRCARSHALTRSRSRRTGEAYDSGPVDFTSERGVQFLAPPGGPEWRRACSIASARLLNTFLLPEFEARACSAMMCCVALLTRACASAAAARRVLGSVGAQRLRCRARAAAALGGRRAGARR
jgi:hypothetical protein